LIDQIKNQFKKIFSSPKKQNIFIDDNKIQEVTKFNNEQNALIAETGFKSQNQFNPRRATRAYEIIRTFFKKDDFYKKEVLELGPGHFAFSLLSRYLGASITCIELDDTFVKIGRAFGLNVLKEDFFNLNLNHKKFDGIIIKGTVNFCHFKTSEQADAWVSKLLSHLNKGGWVFYCPVNKSNNEQENYEEYIDNIINNQFKILKKNGFNAHDISIENKKKLACNYSGCKFIYTLNLNNPESKKISVKVL